MIYMPLTAYLYGDFLKGLSMSQACFISSHSSGVRVGSFGLVSARVVMTASLL